MTNMDRSTGVAGATDVEYLPYHLESGRPAVPHVYHESARPSHLLLPVIPA